MLLPYTKHGLVFVATQEALRSNTESSLEGWEESHISPKTQKRLSSALKINLSHLLYNKIRRDGRLLQASINLPTSGKTFGETKSAYSSKMFLTLFLKNLFTRFLYIYKANLT